MTDLTAAQWNERCPIGTPVIAYPGVRPEFAYRPDLATRLETRTRSRAQMLGGHTAAVWVEGHAACIALTHIDLVDPQAGEVTR